MVTAPRHTTFEFLQDTVPVKKRADSLQGIDSELLKSELRRAEIEKHKQQAAQKLVKPNVTKPITDTICNFCPVIPAPSLEQSLITNLYQQSGATDDRICGIKEFNEATKTNPPVFIETVSRPNSSGDYPAEKPISRHDLLPDLAILPAVLLLVLFIFARRTFARYIVNLIQSALQPFYAEKVFKEKSVLGQIANLILDVLYFLSVPFILFFLVNHIEPAIVESIGSVWFIAYTLIALVALRLYRFVTVKTMAYVSDNWSEMGFLYFNQQMYSRVIGLLLSPLVFLISYTEGSLQSVVIYFAAALLSIFLLLNQFRTFQVFIRKGFSIFYLLLYLCALEIIPLLVIYKELRGVD